MANKSTVKQETAQEAPNPQNMAALWQQVLDETQSGGGSSTFFLKGGRTYLRLVPIETDPNSGLPVFFTTTTSTYNGQARERYLITAQVIKTDQGDLGEQWLNKVVPVLIPKSLFRGILTILSEGYDLLSPEGGHGIIIRREGSGISTEYSVMPSARPIPLDPHLVMPSMSLAEMSEAYIEHNSRFGREAEGEGAGPKPKTGNGKQERSLGSADSTEW